MEKLIMFGLCVKVSVINTSSVLFVLVSDKLDLYDSHPSSYTVTQ